jgi:hypothetical protein
VIIIGLIAFSYQNREVPHTEDRVGKTRIWFLFVGNNMHMYVKSVRLASLLSLLRSSVV